MSKEIFQQYVPIVISGTTSWLSAKYYYTDQIQQKIGEIKRDNQDTKQEFGKKIEKLGQNIEKLDEKLDKKFDSNKTEKNDLKRYNKTMYSLIECMSCGLPCGVFIQRLEFYLKINKQSEAEVIIQYLEELSRKYPESICQIEDFILTSVEHMKIYLVTPDDEKINALINQWNLIYPYPEIVINQKFEKVLKDPILKNIFETLNLCNQKHFKKDENDRNFVREFLDTNNFSKQCCRNYMLTNQKFYEYRDSL